MTGHHIQGTPQAIDGGGSGFASSLSGVGDDASMTASTFGVAQVGRCRKIIAEVAAAHRLSVADICGHARSSRFVVARHEAIWTCRRITKENGAPRYSTTFLGDLFGGRDHTSILHAVRRHDERLAAEKVAA
jgi:chromosomal replication initiator protein